MGLQELIILAIYLMLYLLSSLCARIGVQVASLIFCLSFFNFNIIYCLIISCVFFVNILWCYRFFCVDISSLWMQWESILGAIVKKCTSSKDICIVICIPLEIWHEPAGFWRPRGDQEARPWTWYGGYSTMEVTCFFCGLECILHGDYILQILAANIKWKSW